MATIDIPEHPTKAQELDVWRAFLSQLPPCTYLALYFRESAEFLEQAMRVDMCIDAASDIRKAHLERLRELSEITERKDKAKAELDSLTRAVLDMRTKATRLRSEFEDIRAAARVLSRHADEHYAQAVAACQWQGKPGS